jgi:hypothetical protein
MPLRKHIQVSMVRNSSCGLLYFLSYTPWKIGFVASPETSWNKGSVASPEYIIPTFFNGKHLKIFFS